MAKSKLRFTIRTLFIVGTIASACAYHWHIAARLRVAEAELRKLRTETGRITVEDRTKVHVIHIDTGERDSWRWRLFIPQGHRFKWNAATEGIPLSEPPARAAISSVSNEPYWDRDNEILVTARLVRTAEGATLSVNSKIGDSRHQLSGIKLSVPPEHLDWMKETSAIQSQVLGSKEVTMADPKKTIILLTKRPMKRLPDGGTDFHQDPSPGFMVWLSPH